MKPVKLNPFFGENNRLPDHKLWTKDGSFVRSAINVDVTDADTFQRREGSTKVISGTDCHSFFDGYFVDTDQLKDFAENIILSGLRVGKPMSYCVANGETYCTNGQGLWRIKGSTATPVGIQAPSSTPTLSVQSGSLPKGLYRVAISFIAPDGEESGASYPVAIDLPDGSAISLTNIEQRVGYETAVYISSANGTDLYREVLTTATSYSHAVPNNGQGIRCRTSLLTAMPAGDIVCYLNGRLYVAQGNNLIYSEPYALGLTNPAKNYIPFAEPITMLEPCQNGLYVSADQTYWVAGDIEKAELNPVLPYKAVKGTSCSIANSNNVWWMSERGAVLATPNGEVKNLQEATVAVDPAKVGASMFREQDGMKQMVASLFSPQQTVMAASSFMAAEVVRKETLL